MCFSRMPKSLLYWELIGADLGNLLLIRMEITILNSSTHFMIDGQLARADE